jgi:predicted PurR-regulated permease PerM
MPDGARPVPWPTIIATIASVLAVGVGILLIHALARVIAWLAVALFLTVVLTAPVDHLERRFHLRRGLATAAVFVAFILTVLALGYVFVRPIIDQGTKLIDNLPKLVDDAQKGRGTIGHLVTRYNLQDYVDKNQDRIRSALASLGTPALGVLRGVFSTLLAGVTILVLTCLMLLRGPQLSRGALLLVPEAHRSRVRAVAIDAARAVSGYMFGNLLISAIAGTLTYVLLKILGVPYAEVLALWVAFTDLIPLVGATLGAIVTVGLAFLHSVVAGIVVLVFYIAYQQFENHVLQVNIMSRTVNVSPLTVLVSVLVGVELAGFLGALLAIPAAGVVSVIVRDIYDAETGHLRKHPTPSLEERPPQTAGEGSA